MRRLLLAFLSAPLLPAALQAALGESEYHPLAVFVIAAIAIYVLQLTVGIPGYLFLRPFEEVLTGLLASAWFGFLETAATTGLWLVARPDRRVAPSDPAILPSGRVTTPMPGRHVGKGPLASIG
ncbi:MAG TPA: hypothetical protein VKA75_11185 [Reyranella sp.]|nr:hypothetical protein [Reyranella sp.]